MNSVLAYKPGHQSVLVKAINGIEYVYFSNGEAVKGTEIKDCEDLTEFKNALRSRGFVTREIEKTITNGGVRNEKGTEI